VEYYGAFLDFGKEPPLSSFSKITNNISFSSKIELYPAKIGLFSLDIWKLLENRIIPDIFIHH